MVNAEFISTEISGEFTIDDVDCFTALHFGNALYILGQPYLGFGITELEIGNDNHILFFTGFLIVTDFEIFIFGTERMFFPVGFEFNVSHTEFITDAVNFVKFLDIAHGREVEHVEVQCVSEHGAGGFVALEYPAVFAAAFGEQDMGDAPLLVIEFTFEVVDITNDMGVVEVTIGGSIAFFRLMITVEECFAGDDDVAEAQS